MLHFVTGAALRRKQTVHAIVAFCLLAASVRRLLANDEEKGEDGAIDVDDSVDKPSQTGTVYGKRYPWFLCPYVLNGHQRDEFEHERRLFDKVQRRSNITYQKHQLRAWHFELCRLSPAYYIHCHLRIRNKDAQMVPFDHWNAGQRAIYWAFISSWKEERPVRIIILKARQMGASTLIEALLFWKTTLWENQETAVLADRADHATGILKMAIRFYDHLHHTMLPEEIPQLARVGERKEDGELALAIHNRSKARSERQKGAEPESGTGPVLNSTFRTLTAKAATREHSFTLFNLHATEVPYYGSAAETIWSGLANTIPGRPRTIAIMEGTANGAGDWFNQRWDSAEARRSEFRPVFYGWQLWSWQWYGETAQQMEDRTAVPPWQSERGTWQREYSTELPGEFRSRQGREAFLRTMTKEEREIQTTYGLSLEQILWRRLKVEDAASGRAKEFRQEYPSTAAEAFLVAGNNVFRAEDIEFFLAQTNPELPRNKPLFAGRFLYEQEGPPGLLPARDANDLREAWVRVWHEPEAGAAYILSADPSAGESEEADWCSGTVWRIPDASCQKMREEVHIFCNGGTTVFAEQLAAAYYYFGFPLVVPEATGAGWALITELRRLDVSNVLLRRIEDKAGNVLSTKVGFWTNGQTKEALVGQLRRWTVQRNIELHGQERVKQMRRFIRQPDGGYGTATSRDHDDAVMDLGLGLMGLLSEQIVPPGAVHKIVGSGPVQDHQEPAKFVFRREPLPQHHPELGAYC